MQARDLFQRPDVQIPLRRGCEETGAFLKGVFDRYLALIGTLDEADQIGRAIKGDMGEIRFLCDSIVNAIAAYHSGLPATALRRLSEGIEKVWPRLALLVSETLDHPQYNQFYRIRTAGPEGGDFAKKDLFHIPFGKRHVVQRQRYSIPGLPCLYLGATLHLCWIEMGRPAFPSIYISRHERVTGQSLRLLDLSINPPYAAHMFTLQSPPFGLRDYSVAVAAIWPIMAACSVRKEYENAPFIPQLLLQWVTERDLVDGIQYCSVKLPPSALWPFSTVNIVCPTRKAATSEDGICDRLRSKFALTEPASWQLLASSETQPFPHTEPYHANMPFELVRGQETLYRHTEFGQMEFRMMELEPRPL